MENDSKKTSEKSTNDNVPPEENLNPSTSKKWLIANKRKSAALAVILFASTLGVFSLLTSSQDNTKEQVQESSQQENIVATEKTQMEVAEEIYSEVAKEFELERDSLRLFWVYGDDRVAFASKGQGPGWITAYKTGGKWKTASDAIQYFVTCDELRDIPEEYKPACASSVGGAQKYQYTNATDFTDSTSIMLASVNYPESEKFILIEKEETSENTINTVPNGYVLYEDKEIGISFLSPKTWGTPKLNVQCPGEIPCEGIVRFFKYENVIVHMGGVTSEFSYPTGGIELGSDGYKQSDIGQYEILRYEELTDGNQHALLTEDFTDQAEVDYGIVYRYKLEFNLANSIVDGFAIYVPAQETSVTKEDILTIYRSFQSI